uniref:Uncharacterized protein n=1 Tax=Triticum urartu TaxID=4572 RepID=A0A8R7PT80_TRIUA
LVCEAASCLRLLSGHAASAAQPSPVSPPSSGHWFPSSRRSPPLAARPAHSRRLTIVRPGETRQGHPLRLPCRLRLDRSCCARGWLDASPATSPSPPPDQYCAGRPQIIFPNLRLNKSARAEHEEEWCHSGPVSKT